MNYIKGDVLKSKRTIVHCVSADFAMGAGIARCITDAYGRDNIHKAKKLGVGHKDVSKDKYILYMVTKEKYWMKPTLNDMHQTLINLRIKCEELNIIKLAMPMIGCGLDRLSWRQVEPLIIAELINYSIAVDVHTL